MDEIINTITAKAGDLSYEIFIGSHIFKLISTLKEAVSSDGLAVVVSSKVYELHEEYIRECLQSIPKTEIFIMEDGEENKNYKYAEKFLQDFVKKGLNRKSVVIGIGGGVVGDFAGYLSALYMRGIPIIHIPTTLLAMVDSSIGGKVAVNLSVGKNIVGVFHQPKLVISDVQFLHTLPDDELKNGLTESLKHGLIGDYNTLELLEENDLISIRNDNVISKLIYHSAFFKSSIVEEDEKEVGLRAILNYGHTIGHAVESLLEYKGISHGEAVAVGIKAEMEISRSMGWLSSEELDRINNLMNRYGLGERSISLDIDELLSHMRYDKKNSNDKIKFVLLKGIGNPLINQSIEEGIIKDLLKNFYR